MNAETTIVATRIGDCVVLTVPEDLGEEHLRQLECAARRCSVSALPRAMVFDMSALKYADLTELCALVALANAQALLGMRPILAGLSPGIIMYWVDAGAETGSLETCLDLADALSVLGLTVGGGRT